MIPFIRKNQSILLYGFSLALVLFFLKWLELRFTIFDQAFEIYIGCIAVIFTTLGIWLALKLSKPKVVEVVVEKEVFISPKEEFIPDSIQMNQLQLSNRELEILQLIAQGHSNEEIAGKMFLSISTVKTHNQNLFFKLDVKRRTQAVEKARRLQIIP